MPLTSPCLHPRADRYTFVAYIAISAHMGIVRGFGSVVAVLVGNTRKVVTIALSYFLFPKPLHGGHMLGIALVFAGLIGTVLERERLKALATQRRGLV